MPVRPPQSADLDKGIDMSVLRQPRVSAFRSLLDLNGPVLGPAFYLFESVRSYIEERKEAFDARFGTDTAAPVLGRDRTPGAYFYVATTASVIYEILNSLALQADTFAFDAVYGAFSGRGQIDANGKQVVAESVTRYIARIGET